MDAKATLGLGGVAVVLGAVMAAMGLFSYLRVPSSLVVLQVVPFLVLAVGADNIFIFVLEYQVSAPPRPPVWRPRLPTPCHAVHHSRRTQHFAFTLCHTNVRVPHELRLALRQPRACGEGSRSTLQLP